MFVQPFYFVSYYFYWIEYDDYFFHFQETCNSWLRERYGDDPLTHLDLDPKLWMEVGSSGGPYKNRVYGLSNITARTCGRPLVSQPLRAPNQYRAPNLRSSWPCSNTRFSSPKNMTTYRLGIHNSRWIMNSFAKSTIMLIFNEYYLTLIVNLIFFWNTFNL